MILILTVIFQVLGLWRVVSDHQFHTVAASLTLDEQNMLRGMYFRDLIISVSGKELSSRLVSAVIQQYLADNASTDAISHRLRNVCPSLYHCEDAISSKVRQTRHSSAGKLSYKPKL